MRYRIKTGMNKTVILMYLTDLVIVTSPYMTEGAATSRPPLVSHGPDGLLYISFSSPLTVALSLSACQAEVGERVGGPALWAGQDEMQERDTDIGL